MVIVVAGVGLTAFSRQQRVDELGSPTSQVPPRANQDHWHTAYGVYVCDKWLDPVTDQNDPSGIHTHGDGVIHIHPFVSKAAGKNATFGKFTSAVKAKVDATSFTWPAGSGTVKKKKGDKCGETAGELKVFFNGEVKKGDPKDIVFTDRGKLVIAWVPADVTAEKIGDPPSLPNLDNLTDLAPGEGNTSVSIPDDPTVSTPPGDPTATTAPGDTTATTAAPASTTPMSAPPASDTTAPPTSAGG